MSTVSPLVNVDWPTFAAAAATFAGALYLSLKGAKKGKERVQSGESELTAIVGASLIESSSVKQLTEQLRANTAALDERTRDIRDNTAAIQRNTDILILTHRDR